MPEVQKSWPTLIRDIVGELSGILHPPPGPRPPPSALRAFGGAGETCFRGLLALNSANKPQKILLPSRKEGLGVGDEGFANNIICGGNSGGEDRQYPLAEINLSG